MARPSLIRRPMRPVNMTYSTSCTTLSHQTYAEWLKANPAPNFAALIARHGSYEAIPPQAWTAFADAQLEWERRRRMRAAEDGPFA